MTRRVAELLADSIDGRAEQAEIAAADAIGQLMQFWGFKRPMGRVWTLIYLAREPSDAATLASRLKMSAGSMSMTLAELSRWGTIRKTWRPGDRKDYYEAETSIAKMVARVLRERELRLVREVRDTLGDALEALDGGDDQLDFKKERIHRLWQLAQVGESLLEALAAGKRVDPTPIREVGGDDDPHGALEP
jgi:DNA-binding transcriptional regulator GbsR (MarR family)